MSANEAAAMLALSPTVYCAAENGKDPDTIWELVKSQTGDQDKIYGKLTPSEQCSLARRRSRVEISELCARLGGISKPTFLKREREANPDIVNMWKMEGYIF